MSVKIMGQVWELDLPYKKLWTLMAMADHADHEGKNVFPALPFVAWKTGYSLSSIKRIVKELKADGILKPYSQTRGGVVKYEIDLSHVPRKAEYEAPESGRPLGNSPKSEKTQCHFDTGFDPDNHQSLISNQTREEVAVSLVSNSSSFNYATPQNFGLDGTMTTQLTLADLRAFDATPQGNGKWQRFLCPLCGSGKTNEAAHRCLTVDVSSFGFVCHRCGAKGRLGQEAGFAPRAPIAPPKPKTEWQSVWEKANPKPLLGTAGEKYLRGRSIDPLKAAQSGVMFSGGLYGRAAVCFPIRDANGVLVAVQGRHIDRCDPRMHTIGAVKAGVFATEGAFDVNCLAVTEAPLDALSFAEMFNIPAIAVCGSAALPGWVLTKFKGELLLASDNDAAGEKAAAIWANQAGRRIATRRMAPQGKDWNEELAFITQNAPAATSDRKKPLDFYEEFYGLSDGGHAW